MKSHKLCKVKGRIASTEAQGKKSDWIVQNFKYKKPSQVLASEGDCGA